MPLIRSASNKARSENIREMVEAGHPQAQAVAASYREQREMRHGTEVRHVHRHHFHGDGSEKKR